MPTGYISHIDPLLALGDMEVAVPSILPEMSASGSFVVQGLNIVPLPSGIHHVERYVGETNVPHDIARLRRYTFEVMRRVGQPVLVKKMLTDADRYAGVANQSPNFDTVYGQSRNEDLLSYGTGFVSVVKSDDEFIDTRGKIFRAEDNPGEYEQAPKYRGFGPGYLTYIVEPDAATDFYKHTPEGVFIRIQQAHAQAPWWPAIGDNDLVINVTLDAKGDILQTNDRYQAKMTNPVSIRGLDRRGRQEYSGDSGNRHVINQTFEMSLLPQPHVLYRVDVDR